VLPIVIYNHYNYMFRPPEPSSVCVEDLSKSTIHYWMFLKGGFWVGGEGGEEKGKKTREEKGGEGEGGTNEISFFVVPYMLLRNYVLCISMVY
jgi:hypothetical protein